MYSEKFVARTRIKNVACGSFDSVTKMLTLGYTLKAEFSLTNYIQENLLLSVIH